MTFRRLLGLVAYLVLGALTATATGDTGPTRCGYDIPACVVRITKTVESTPATATTRPVNRRTATLATRPGSRTLPGLVRRAPGRSSAAKAGTGGINAVRLGQAGEDAVRGAYNIGDKVPISVAGRGRIPDGLTTSTLSEVKNTASLSYTQQLRDFAQYAQQTGRSFDLYVRSTTRLSGPLQREVANGSINLRFIP